MQLNAILCLLLPEIRILSSVGASDCFIRTSATLRENENSGDFGCRLPLLEEPKTMLFSAVWDYCCLQHDIPIGIDWNGEGKQYETRVLRKENNHREIASDGENLSGF